MDFDGGELVALCGLLCGWYDIGWWFCWFALVGGFWWFGGGWWVVSGWVLVFAVLGFGA